MGRSKSPRRLQVGWDLAENTLVYRWVDVRPQTVLRYAGGGFDCEDVLGRQGLLTAQPLRDRALCDLKKSGDRRL